jgi:hypothetical protein
MLSQNLKSIMVRGMLVAVFLLATVSIHGCGGGSRTAAVEAAFNSYLVAIKTKNLDIISGQVTGWQHKKLLGQGAKRRLENYVAALPTDIKVIKVEIAEHGKAVVLVEGKVHVNAKEQTGIRSIKGKFDMVNEGNIWKVNKETWK